MKYYGVRYAKDCHPDDLWKTYFTSSKYVTKYRKEHGEPDVIQVRQTFSELDRVHKSQKWENRVLNFIDVAHRRDYLNKTNNHSFDNSDEETEQLRKNNAKKAQSSTKYLQKLSDAATKQWTDPEMRTLMIERQKNGSSSKKAKDARSKQHGVKAPNVDIKVYVFIHDSNIIEICTRSALKKKYNLRDSGLHGVVNRTKKRSKHLGWSLV